MLHYADTVADESLGFTPVTPIREPRRLLVPLAALACLVLFNYVLNQQAISIGFFLFGLSGIGLWIAALLAGGAFREDDVAASSPWIIRLPLVVAAVGLGVAAYLLAANNTFRLPGVIAWFAAVVFWVIGFWPREQLRVRSGAGQLGPSGLAATGARFAAHPLITMLAAIAIAGALLSPLLLIAIVWFLPWENVTFDRSGLNQSADLLRGPAVRVMLVVGVVAIGAWFRFHLLHQIPSDPWSDHAEKLYDVTDVLNGKYSIFFPRNTGREAMQFYLTAFGLIRGLGMDPVFYTLKVSIALLDTFAVLTVFLFAAELAGFTTGIFASFFFAVGAWPVVVARIGLRPAIGSLTTSLALWLLLRYLRTGNRQDAIWCGLAMGFGLYGYSAFRSVPIAVAIILAIALLVDPRHRHRRRALIGDGLVMAGTTLVALAPMVRYAVDDWSMLWYRTTSRTGTTEAPIEGSRLGTFIDNNIKMLKVFNWKGMDTIIQMVVGVPLLDLITGALLIAGFIVVLYMTIARRSLRFASILIAFPILSLSSTLALAFPIECPSATRSDLLAPLIFTMAAMPVGLIVTRLWANFPRDQALALTLGGALLLAAPVTWINYDRYFNDYNAQYLREALPMVDIGHTINAAVEEHGLSHDDVYLLNIAYWIDHRIVALEIGDIPWADTHNIAPEMPTPAPQTGHGILYVLHPTDTTRIDELNRLYPNGQWTEFNTDSEKRHFLTFWVPPA